MAWRTVLAGVLVTGLVGCGDDDGGGVRDAASDDGGAGESDGETPVDVPIGLEARPANPTCRAPSRPVVVATGDYQLRPLFPNLVTGTHGGHAPIVARRVRMPTLTADPQNPGKVLPGPYTWFVGLRTGRVFEVRDPNAAAPPADNLREPDHDADISQSEGGFLGLAFDPDIATDPARAFVYFTRTDYVAGQNYLWLWRARVETTLVSGALRHRLVQPTSIFRAFTTSHHHGGEVLFGPDGYLYVSVGEGDLGAGAQNPRELRGKILRFDVHSSALTPNYGVPASNPFAGGPACSDTSATTLHAQNCPEVYAVGFRNPFRFSFDRQTGALWVADVGSQHEEINLVEAGKNYGWNTYEGPEPLANPAFVPSVSEIPRAGCTGYGYAIIGGFVYRGPVPSLQGKYVAADNDAGKLYVLESPYAPSRTLRRIYNETCSDQSFHPASFAEDENGALYVVSLDLRAGRGILGIEPRTMEMPPPGGVPLSPTLSGTGCFDTAARQPASGLIPFEVNAELWSDGAAKRRWMALFDGARVSVQPDGDWDFPIGTVLVKEFAFAGKPVETRLLVRHDDGDWAGYAYQWNAAATEAYLLEDGAEVPVAGGPAWHIPSRAECLACHTTAKRRALGPETRQMNRSAVYPGGRRANQLDTLSAVGVIDQMLSGAGAPAFASPAGTGDVAARARAYLHANCSHCHPGPGAKPDFGFDTAISAMRICREPPTTAVPGGTQLLVPGDPAHSILSLRMHDTGAQRMPRLGSRRVDPVGTSVVDQWITSGAGCP